MNAINTADEPHFRCVLVEKFVDDYAYETARNSFLNHQSPKPENGLVGSDELESFTASARKAHEHLLSCAYCQDRYLKSWLMAYKTFEEPEDAPK
jgi:hypothetical protein